MIDNLRILRDQLSDKIHDIQKSGLSNIEKEKLHYEFELELHKIKRLIIEENNKK